jgi:hypothetical protein
VCDCQGGRLHRCPELLAVEVWEAGRFDHADQSRTKDCGGAETYARSVERLTGVR